MHLNLFFNRVLILAIVISASILSCSTHENASGYSFYVVGHAYGNPIVYQYGIYPPLAKFFPYLNQKDNIAFGVFTGDVVPKATPAYWDSAALDLKTLKKPYYIAPGNHDRGAEFDKRYPGDTVFQYKNDQYVILNTEKWMVSVPQIEMIKNSIKSLGPKGNLFIFCHELVWWAPDNEYSNVEINYRPQYPGKTNFDSEVLPELSKTSQNVYWFAGDIGCKPECTPYVLSKKENIHLIANGVGGGLVDNCLIVDVSNNGNIAINAIVFDKNGRPKSAKKLN